MTQITKIDRTTLRILKEEIEKAVQPIAEKYGVQITAGGGSFTDSSYTMKLITSVVGEGGVAQTREVADFERYANLFGMKPEDFGTVFTSDGTKYQICGLKPNSPKYPILAKKVGTSNTYKFHQSTVMRALGRK